MYRVSTTVFSKTGIPIMIENTGKTEKAAIEGLYSGIKYGVDTYGWTMEPKPGVSPPASQDQGQTAKREPGPIVKTPKVATERKTGTSLVAKMEVVPQADQMVQLKLYEAGHKFVDFYYQASRAETLAMLENTGLDWEEKDLAEANEFAAKFYVDWIESEKLNSNNKPYKDVTGFRPYLQG